MTFDPARIAKLRAWISSPSEDANAVADEIAHVLDTVGDDIDRMRGELDRVTADRDRLRTALEWYADNGGHPSTMADDGGAVARAALHPEVER